MKKYFSYAFAGAIALTGAVGFAACSTSGEDVVNNTPINNPTNIPEQEFVKTQFAISLPANVNAATTRMVAVNVQEADNSFRGMQDIVLIPFVGKPTTATATRAGDEITLTNIATSGVTNLGSSNDNYKVYNDVRVPLGTSAFLFYAQADKGSLTDFQNGKTLKNAPSTAGTAGYTFSPVVIYDGSTNTKGEAIATYLTNIANATGWKESTGALKTLYDQFISLKAGSSASVQAFVTNLLNEIKGNTDAVSVAIITAMGTTYATVSGEGSSRTVSLNDVISGYPANLNLPDGAAAVKWDTSNSSDLKFVVDNTGNTGGAMTSYVYPAALWYTTNTDIVVSNTKQADNNGSYPSGKTTWDNNATTGIFSLYTDGGAVTPTTRSIALKNQIQYAVGRLDVTVKCEAGTLYDQRGNAVTVDAGGFPVSAVLIGGQKSVDFTFSNPTGTAYTIYDNVVSGVAAKNGVAEGKNYTLALETAVNEDVNVAIELTNNTSTDFYGKNGELIPKGGKFYLSTTLTAATATTTSNKIFKQDYYTIVNLTIKPGNASQENTIGLAAATNVIPDLRTPSLELGLAVDLHWQAGNTFNIDI